MYYGSSNSQDGYHDITDCNIVVAMESIVLPGYRHRNKEVKLLLLGQWSCCAVCFLLDFAVVS